MNTKTFKSINGLELIIKNRKSAVIFELDKDEASSEEFEFLFEFSPEGFIELVNYIETVACECWPSLSPKEADSMVADYDEYYDRQLDSNGYLSIKKNALLIERPVLDNQKLYQFNKRKMESFIYDCRRGAN
ncbi:hypothetical protein [Bacillus sp. Hm123]|uniref:hypothetical protein n=1 Tax=Bacillus sp. Hm123 TaxID=3450745 RepID=UPI003F43B7DF